MPFVYDPSNIIAREEALGLTVDLDHRYREPTVPRLVFTDTVTGRTWVLPIDYIHERRPDLTAEIPGSTYMADVACRIPRRNLELIGIEVAAEKAAQGHNIGAKNMTHRLLAGATVYVTGGGSLMAEVHDFRFILTDDWAGHF